MTHLDRGEDRWVDPLRERVAAIREVVVPEHDEARPELAQKPLEERRATTSRDEVAGDADEVGLALRDPGHRVRRGALPPRRDAQMEVGEVRDPQAVERRRDAGELDFEHSLPQPTRLEPAPGERA